MIQVFSLSGRGDMGSLTDRTIPPRFYLPVPIYSLATFRVVFSIEPGNTPTGTGGAPLYLKVDHRDGLSFDRTIFSWLNVGLTGGNIEFRIDAEERDTFRFYRNDQWNTRDELVLIWTDPDGGKLTNWIVNIELQEESA